MALLLLLPATSRSQNSADLKHVMLESRINRELDTTMHVLYARTIALNTRIADMNRARPLEFANLDSAHVVQNVGASLAFVEYLKHYRDTSEMYAKQLEDSLAVFQSELPDVPERALIKKFAEAHMADQKADATYIGTLASVYSDVLDVLLYLQHTSYTLQKDKIVFKVKSDEAKYLKLMTPINEGQTKLQTAIFNSKRAKAKAQDALSKLAQNGVPKDTAKKKSSKQ